jgi:hypothetical protein
MSANFTTSDNEKSVSMTTTNPINLEDPNWSSFNSALSGLNSIAPVATVSVVGDVCTITLKDARTFVITLVPASPPTFMISTGTSAFNQSEFNDLRAVGNAVLTLMAVSLMTAVTVTYN